MKYFKINKIKAYKLKLILTTMFGITMLEFIHILTSILSAGMAIVLANQCFENIDNSFIKLKKEKKVLEAEIEELKKEKQTTDVFAEVISEDDINETLLRENLRLAVRCDMLTAMRKIRQETEIDNY